MATVTKERERKVQGIEMRNSPTPPTEPPSRAGVGSEAVWHEVEKGSFAIISYVTPNGEPRSSGVIYKAVDRRLYVVVAPDSWKARHIAWNLTRKLRHLPIAIIPRLRLGW